MVLCHCTIESLTRDGKLGYFFPYCLTCVGSSLLPVCTPSPLTLPALITPYHREVEMLHSCYHYYHLAPNSSSLVLLSSLLNLLPEANLHLSSTVPELRIPELRGAYLGLGIDT